ncbi:hypothetical protein, partial [Pseudomonas gingeri]|uniref:hypothetical protein n=2 Tax=Pseudomonas TaxID=286 RepID=UPI001C43121F
MTTAISGNPSTSSWHHWQQKTDEKNNNATSHQPGTHQVSTHNREAGRSRQERSQASSHLTQHKYNAAPQTPNPTDTASAAPYKP